MPARIAQILGGAALAAALTVPAAAPLAAQSDDAPTPAATLERAAQRYGALRSLRASFSQEITNPLTGTVSSSHGELLQRMPGQIAVNFTDPAGDRIISDGKTLWLYLPSTNPGQVIKVTGASGAGAAGAFDIVAQLVQNPSEHYTATGAGTATVDGHPTHAVLLTPRPNSQAPFAKATVWVDDDDSLVRQLRTEDASGLTRLIRITSLDVNAPVSRKAFQFTVPEGVRVIERGTPAG